MNRINHIARTATLALGVCLAIVGLSVASAHAQTIIDEWANAKAPAPPTLKPVTISDSDTALLVLDFTGAQDPTKGPCNAPTNPRCIASLPKVQHLIAEARAKSVFIVYSLAGSATPADIATALAPMAGDPVVKAGADKYVGTDLDKLLSGKGIKTVIVTGTRAEGAVLDTATDAVFRGLNVIVPVDGMSSTDLYPEQYVAWHLTHAPSVSVKTTLTSIDMIKF